MSRMSRTSRKFRVARPLAAALLVACAAAAPLRAQAPIEVHESDITTLADALSAGRTTSVALVDAYLARIRAYDHEGVALNAIVRLNPSARADAEALDRERRASGARGPLHGIPVLVKDNYEVAGLATSAGSIALAGWVPPRDAAVVERLRAAGAVILGMTNMHELAHGITTITSIGGQTLNPYDPARNPGGSSGGTGAAIAASFAALGWGSDTCGSIRIPAAHQNLFGLRPTFGMFSLDGIVPLSHSQDTPGPLARSALDLALGLDATSGPESAVPDASGASRPPRFADAARTGSLEGVRIGVLTNWLGGGDEAEAARIVRAALDSIGARGAELIEVSIPDLDGLLAGSSTISYDLKWDLNDFLAARPAAPVRSLHEMLDRGLYARAMEGQLRARDTVSARDSDERRAVVAKQGRVREVLEILFAAHDLDALAYPTVRRKAALIGEGQQGSSCQLSAASGFPAITMPAGFTNDELPIGLELLGRPHADELLVGYAHAYERLFHPRRAPARTPALVGGRAPRDVSFTARIGGGAGAGAEVRFVYSPAASALSYVVRVSGRAGDVHAVTLDVARDDGGKGAVAHRLAAPGQVEASGRIQLGRSDREALLGGRFELSLYAGGASGGVVSAPLAVPET